MKGFFSFPNPVNDAAARSVALGVLTLSVITFASGQAWLLILLTYGFAARVAAGPKISPLGWFAVHVSGPRLKSWEKFVPGPPKRFAQSMGLAFSSAALLTWLSVGWLDARWILLPLMAAAVSRGIGRILHGMHRLWLAHPCGRDSRIHLRRVRRPLCSLPSSRL